jgi:MFS family permease
MNVSGRTVAFIASANVAQLPTAMQSLLLVLLGHRNTGSYLVAGVAAAGAAAGFGLAAPLMGRMLGRYGHRPVLLATGAAALLAHGGLVLTRTPVLFVLVATGLGLLTPPAASNARALLAETVPEPALRRAYAVNALAQELIYVAGPLWVTLWITGAGPAAAVVSCALLGTASLVLSVFLAPATRSGDAIRLGGPSVLRRPGVRTLVLVNLSYMTCMGAMWVLVPAFASAAGQSGHAGLLVAIWSLGSATGGLVLSLLRNRVPLRPAYLTLLGLLGATSLPLALTASVWQFALALAVFGLALAPWLAVSDGLLAAAAPPPRTAEAYGWLVTAGQAGTALGSTIAGPLADHRPGGPSFLFVTAALLVALGIALLRRRTFPPERSTVDVRSGRKAAA